MSGTTTKAYGLLVRQTKWHLSWRGRLLVLLVVVIVGLVGARFLHPFLAVTQLSGGSLLVVEGWIPTHTLKGAAEEFRAGHYQRVLVVFGTADDLGNQYDSGRYNGDYVAKLLVQYGVPAESVQTLFYPLKPKDRTFQEAIAVKHWLAQQPDPVKAFDVLTLGPHARRSRLLFEKAFGNGFGIGVIALNNAAYDPRHWWRSSEGVREVIGESIAYVYARFFFFPGAETA
jgi:hypothetical protein